jgi:Flp pilus assembly pilin Flp
MRQGRRGATCREGCPITDVLARFIASERGAAAIEYCLIAALAGLAVFGAVKPIGPELKDVFANLAPAGIRRTATVPHFRKLTARQSRHLPPPSSLREAPLGIVYATDAAADPEVNVVATFPADSRPAIVYPFAATTQKNAERARSHRRFLQGSAARGIFVEQGFRSSGRRAAGCRHGCPIRADQHGQCRLRPASVS